MARLWTHGQQRVRPLSGRPASSVSVSPVRPRRINDLRAGTVCPLAWPDDTMGSLCVERRCTHAHELTFGVDVAIVCP